MQSAEIFQPADEFRKPATPEKRPSIYTSKNVPTVQLVPCLASASLSRCIKTGRSTPRSGMYIPNLTFFKI